MPERCVVDTDVISCLFRRDTRAELYRRHLTDALIIISFMTVAELDFWALERRWGSARRAAMRQHLAMFTIYLADRPLCLAWAEVVHQARRNGRAIQAPDAWIAATARTLSLPLVTHNRDDYAGVDGLVVLSES